MQITCMPLGAGQDVGKSCVIVTLGGKRIMFDCGLHMGFNDERRFPDFKLIPKQGPTYTEAVDCVIVTHFHLDHCGALPYFTEVCGYDGPIYMTYPTKALAPLMLEDFRRVMVDRKGEAELFTPQQIKSSIDKVTAIDIRQTIRVGDSIEICAYYAGHVLGAAMIYVKVNGESVVYTGDYNMTADRHLGAASIDTLEPDLLITESTYATTVRDSKRARERDFLKAVHGCVSSDGKVLIPVFALGRAQELCILLDEYWERMGLNVPIYFSAGLTAQANLYYKLLINWTSEKVKKSYATRNTFDFKHVSPFDRSTLEAPGPCVLFATPGMLSGGLSLQAFKSWAPYEANMVVLPGFCVAGTVGAKLMGGTPPGGKIELDRWTSFDVRCQVHHLSFSAHTDAKGIMDLIHHVAPRHVVLVHGQRSNIALLRERVKTELNLPCYDPANHEEISVPSQHSVQVSISDELLRRQVAPRDASTSSAVGTRGLPPESVQKEKVALEAVLIAEDFAEPRLIDPSEVGSVLNTEKHVVMLQSVCTLYRRRGGEREGVREGSPPLKVQRKEEAPGAAGEGEMEEDRVVGGRGEGERARVHALVGSTQRVLERWMGKGVWKFGEGEAEVRYRSIAVKVLEGGVMAGAEVERGRRGGQEEVEVVGRVLVSWSYEDEGLGRRTVAILQSSQFDA